MALMERMPIPRTFVPSHSGGFQSINGFGVGVGVSVGVGVTVGVFGVGEGAGVRVAGSLVGVVVGEMVAVKEGCTMIFWPM